MSEGMSMNVIWYSIVIVLIAVNITMQIILNNHFAGIMGWVVALVFWIGYNYPDREARHE